LAEKSILLIEPSESERAELTAVLERLGYEVDSAIGSEDGLKMFAQSRHDLVIVEVLLSGINGLNICKIVKDQSAQWGGKVIVISKVFQSRAMEYDALNRYGADAYFAQPFPLVNLLNAVSALIGEPISKPSAATKPVDQTPEKRRRAKAAPAPLEWEEEPPALPPPSPRAATKPPNGRRRKAASREAPPPAPEVHFAEPAELPDEGEFDPEKLGLLLARLARDQVSGSLALSAGKDAKQVYLIDGRPVFVQSTNQEETLCRMLLADGLLTEEQYREAMIRVGESGKKLGTVLTSLGYLSSEDISFHLSGQTLRKVSRCFAWPHGAYKLHRDKTYPANAPTFEADPAAVLLDAYGRYVESAVIEAGYERDKSKFVFPGGATEMAAMRAQLSADTERLLDAADGAHTLSDVVGESALGLTYTLRVLSALIAFGALRLGVVERRPAVAAREAPTPPPEKPPEPTPREQTIIREIRELAVRLDDLDYFQVLGLKRTAHEDDVNQAYLALRRKYDPDRYGPSFPRQIKRMAVAIIEHMQAAFDVLHDPASRRHYLSQLPGDKPGLPRPPTHDAITPDDPMSTEVRVVVQQALLDVERHHFAVAVEGFRKALVLDPHNADLRVKLAQAMFGALAEPPFTWEDVEDAAKQAAAASKNRSDALALLGRIKARQGDDEAALRYLKKAFDADPKNEAIRRELRYTEQRIKEVEEGGRKSSIFGKKR
jgi:DNA-binding NarL/FixJ family response regulator/curved DNA-binding protein CbpA